MWKLLKFKTLLLLNRLISSIQDTGEKLFNMNVDEYK
jgi:hypothetical protein